MLNEIYDFERYTAKCSSPEEYSKKYGFAFTYPNCIQGVGFRRPLLLIARSVLSGHEDAEAEDAEAEDMTSKRIKAMMFMRSWYGFTHCADFYDFIINRDEYNADKAWKAYIKKTPEEHWMGQKEFNQDFIKHNAVKAWKAYIKETPKERRMEKKVFNQYFREYIKFKKYISCNMFFSGAGTLPYYIGQVLEEGEMSLDEYITSEKNRIKDKRAELDDNDKKLIQKLKKLNSNTKKNPKTIEKQKQNQENKLKENDQERKKLKEDEVKLETAEAKDKYEENKKARKKKRTKVLVNNEAKEENYNAAAFQETPGEPANDKHRIVLEEIVADAMNIKKPLKAYYLVATKCNSENEIFRNVYWKDNKEDFVDGATPAHTPMRKNRILMAVAMKLMIDKIEGSSGNVNIDKDITGSRQFVKADFNNWINDSSNNSTPLSAFKYSATGSNRRILLKEKKIVTSLGDKGMDIYDKWKEQCGWKIVTKEELYKLVANNTPVFYRDYYFDKDGIILQQNKFYSEHKEFWKNAAKDNARIAELYTSSYGEKLW